MHMEDPNTANRRETAAKRRPPAYARIAGLLFVFVVAVICLCIVQAIPARSVKPPVGGGLLARENVVLPALADGQKPRVRGLGYMVPPGLPPIPVGIPGSMRDQLRNVGMLKAYSEPPDRIVFTPNGAPQFLPVSPMPGSARVPGVVSHGNKSKMRVALTFDDGYSGMGNLVDLLVDLRVPATLFPAGGACAPNKAAVLKARNYGFEIANHSWNHPMSTRVSDDGIVREIESSDEKVREICGKGMVAYFRPPNGDYDDRVTRVAGNLGYLVVMWNRDTRDWSPATSADQLISRATDGVQNGDIILMHSHGRYTLSSLPTIVKTLRDKGFELTTVSGVLAP